MQPSKPVVNNPPATGSARWLSIWQQRGWAACLLWPLSRLYALVLLLRRILYRAGAMSRSRLPVPVVVVGNVVIGGAGKTPTVINLVKHLSSKGWSPGVISRGHGRQGDACVAVTHTSASSEVGDEPALIARATGAPMVVGRDRVQAARQLLEQHPYLDIIVSDDGMQHWALDRDLTVVVFDERGIGNGWLLPAGMLREPWPANPKESGPLIVLHNQSTDHAAAPPAISGCYPTFKATRALKFTITNARGDITSLDRLKQEPSLGALAGIAQPDRFFAMLKATGLALQRECPLLDHADGPALLAALHPRTTWLCTEKDAVKLFPLLAQRPDLQVWAVALEQTPEPAFFNAVEQSLKGLSSHHGRQTP